MYSRLVSKFVVKFLKIFTFNGLFSFFLANNFIETSLSGFQPGDSCINQLLSITLEIRKSFDDGLEVTGVFRQI